MAGDLAESLLEVALHSAPIFIRSLGRRPAVAILSHAVYAASDMAWVRYITTTVAIPEEWFAVPPLAIEIVATDEEIESSDGESVDIANETGIARFMGSDADESGESDSAEEMLVYLAMPRSSMNPNVDCARGCAGAPYAGICASGIASASFVRSACITPGA